MPHTYIDLEAEGLTDGDTIDSYLSTYMADGHMVRIPPGTYTWNGDGLVDGVWDCYVFGDGPVEWQLGDPGFRENYIAGGGTCLVKNITQTGQAHGASCSSSDWSRWLWAMDDSAGTLIVDNVNRPDGSASGEGDDIGYLVRVNNGTLLLRDCHVEGFTNNGLYASSSSNSQSTARLFVEGGLYKNNNVASIRVGSHDHVRLDHVTIVHDSDIPDDCGGGDNGRPFWNREPVNTFEAVGCNLYASGSSGTTGAWKQHGDGAFGSGFMQSCVTQNDYGSAAVEFDGDPIDVLDSSFTGSETTIQTDGTTSGNCIGSGCETPITTAGSLPGQRFLLISKPSVPSVTYSFTATGPIEAVSNVGHMSTSSVDVTGNGDGTYTVSATADGGIGKAWQVHGEITEFTVDVSDADLFLFLDEAKVLSSDLNSGAAGTAYRQTISTTLGFER